MGIHINFRGATSFYRQIFLKFVLLAKTTVDGRNPAPVDRSLSHDVPCYFINTSQVVIAGFLPSTVSCTDGMFPPFLAFTLLVGFKRRSHPFC